MCWNSRITRAVLTLFAVLASTCAIAQSDVRAPVSAPETTRVIDPKAHRRTGSGSYPYRAWADYILAQLDIRLGDVVVDIGAGDGWWTEKFAPRVGASGTIHAAEVDAKLVESMGNRFAGTPQVHPFKCREDDTTLPENSCDLAFFSQSFHHLDAGGRIDYLRRLRKVIKPTGRIAIIERYLNISGERQQHGTDPSVLTKEAEAAGWILVRYELMIGTYHYLAIFVQKDLFPPEPRREGRGRRSERF